MDASGGQGGYSKYYGIMLVFHNQESSIEDCLEKHRLWLLDRDLDDIPLHTGTLMTGHDDYDGMEDVAHAVHGAVEYTLSKNGLMYRKTCASEFMLAQAADLLCTLELTALKYKNGEATRTDEKFFGSASTFCLTRDGASPMLRRAPSWLLLWILAPVLPVLRGARGLPVVILGLLHFEQGLDARCESRTPSDLRFLDVAPRRWVPFPTVGRRHFWGRPCTCGIVCKSLIGQVQKLWNHEWGSRLRRHDPSAPRQRGRRGARAHAQDRRGPHGGRDYPGGARCAVWHEGVQPLQAGERQREPVGCHACPHCARAWREAADQLCVAGGLAARPVDARCPTPTATASRWASSRPSGDQ